jgi:hypothetical protein
MLTSASCSSHGLTCNLFVLLVLCMGVMRIMVACVQVRSTACSPR